MSSPAPTPNPRDEMIRFRVKLICAGFLAGAISGGITWILTADPAAAGISAVISALLVWLGGVLMLVCRG